MSSHIRASLWLTLFLVVLSAIVYPAILLGFGQTMCREKANGSLLYDESGNVIGSSLIAQPFSGDEYFHPRPSAVGYNAASTAGSNWAGNNYLLRDRVARVLGPIVKYGSGDKKGQLAAPDIEAWFQQDQYQGQPGIVAQWAALHSTVAANWVKADPLNAAYVTQWQAAHEAEMAKWKKANPENSEPKPEDLAGVFFESYSKENPGTFPIAAEVKAEDDKTEKVLQPAKEGSDIQSLFFDMWRHEYPAVDLEKVPGDMVFASGAGLDPHITLDNAMYQFDRVVSKWVATTQLPEADVQKAVVGLLKSNATAPLNGVAGVPLVNVLEVNVALPKVLSAKH